MSDTEASFILSTLNTGHGQRYPDSSNLPSGTQAQGSSSLPSINYSNIPPLPQPDHSALSHNNNGAAGGLPHNFPSFLNTGSLQRAGLGGPGSLNSLGGSSSNNNNGNIHNNSLSNLGGPSDNKPSIEVPALQQSKRSSDAQHAFDDDDGMEDDDDEYEEEVEGDDTTYADTTADISGYGPPGATSPNANRVKKRGRGSKSTFGAGIAKDSDQYQKLRKENHKNVEKKRRETINDGIKRLASLVPGADKNKSKIINQAADYIESLRREATLSVEKWTLDKLLSEKQLRELMQEVEGLKNEMLKKDLQIEELRRIVSERS